MAERTIRCRATREQVADLLRRVRDALAGTGPDPDGIARGCQLRAGVALLSKVQQAFVVKSRGGVGEDGVKWAPLKRQTIAQRRSTTAERRSLGVGDQRVRGLLTPAQDRRWRAIFAREKAKLMARFGMGEGAAAAQAAKLAWAVLKGEGAKTKLDVLGGRQVDICRDTSAYFSSLTPGVEDRPSGADGQVCEAETGAVIVGSRVPYAAAQHERRPLWPRNGDLPAAWWDTILGAVRQGVLVGVARVLSGGGG